MKTKIFSICFAAVCFFSAHGFAQSANYTINGKLENVSPMPAKMHLISSLNGTLKQDKDSTEVINGEYHFKGELNVDEAVAVIISKNAKLDPSNVINAIALYVDKGELNVVSTGTLKNITVSGSASAAHQQYAEIMAGIEKEKQELKKIATSEAYKTSETMQADVLKRSQALGFKGLIDMYQLAKSHPDNRLSPFITYALISSGLMSATAQDTLMQLLPANVKADRLGKAIIHIPVTRDSLAKAAAAKQMAEAGKIPVGSKAPDFTQYTPQGKAVSLSSLKGKYVLIDFWASWCVPCRNENPNVVKAYNKYKDKGFTVLGVSLDAESARAAWLKAITSDGLTWTQISDLKGWKSEAAALYGVSSIPQNFLIDPNGVVIGKNLRGDDLQKKLASIF
jgi:peroxiredoxin